ncbi:MAG: endonuclease [Chthonomonadaceae bacterium]|nr:endonuclease [Chthonomonadaceae bacterium]
MPRSNSAKGLNKQWDINAHHALYRATGNWYHHLTDFPGALIDESGYVLFETKEAYQTCKYLQLGKEVSVPRGISTIPGYIRVTSGTIQAVDLSEPEGSNRAPCTTYRILRDTPLARKVKTAHNHVCQVCGNTLRLFNTQPYAEAHHIRPLGSPHDGPDHSENVLCVCPNCHVLLDYGAIKLEAEHLAIVEGHRISAKYIEYHNTLIFGRARNYRKTA